MEKRNSFAMKCGYRDRAVSEIIGSILLVAIVVTALSIVGVVLWSQPPPQKIPALDAVISEDTVHNTVHIYHDGGDPLSLSSDDFKILVDGKPTTFSKTVGVPSTWTTGESLDYTYSGVTAPALVQIIYTSAGSSSVLASANFEQGTGGSSSAPTTTITATAGVNGLISPSGSVPVKYHTSQSFTITPETGYHIVSVLVDGSSVGNATTYQFTNVVAAHTISTTFAINTYTITASAGDNGTISDAGVTYIDYSSSKTYTITPNAGYYVADVLIDSSSVGNVTTYQFTNVTADHTISATFTITTNTITASTGANGNVTPAGVTTVNYGGSQLYTITPITSYHVDSVLVDGSSVGNATTYQFTNVTAAHKISATFAINKYTITASAGDHGTISPAGVTTVNSGASQTYTITPTPNTGYHVADVLVDGSSVGNVTSYQFTNVVAAHTISATFAINTYTITASAGSGGTITPAGETPVNQGSSQTYTITPNTNYRIQTLVVDGVTTTYPSTISSTYTFTNVQASHTISATFAVSQYSPGIRADYYRNQNWLTLAYTNYPNKIWFADKEAIDWRGSDYTSDVPNWPYDYIGRTDDFSVRFEGLLKIDTAADYTFHLTSDDGSWLWIDNVQVIDNGGTHAPTEKDSAAIHLTSGYHPIKVDMFENDERAVVYLEYSRPGMTQTYVTGLYHI